MAGSLNKVTLIGNVGQDPEIRTMQDGRQMASFSVATTESWKDKATGEKRDKTEWHNISVFSEGLVRVIQSYVKKGSKLYIEGQLKTDKYTDKDGIERYSTKIVLQNYSGTIILLDSRGNNQGGNDSEGYSGNYGGYQAPNFGQIAQGNAQPASRASSFAHELDDDVPF